MPLRKSTGNMYPWVSHTWNPIFGKCSHDCGYCYMRRWKLEGLRFDHIKMMSTNLGEGKTIFVGSATDMFAHDIPYHWITSVLHRCEIFDKNTYLFQSKNPGRFIEFELFYPPDIILGTTIETNRPYKLSEAPSVAHRVEGMTNIQNSKKTVTIEPILDFDLQPLIGWIMMIGPDFVSIGADSKGHGLTEPSYEQVEELIEELGKFTEVRVKHNLERLKK